MTQDENQLKENKFVAAKCSNCGAPLVVDQKQGKAICEYCGATFIINKETNNAAQPKHNSDNQNGKKGFAQAAFEYLDRQQEREFQKQMDERRRQEEAARLKAIQDEEKRERRKKGWKTFGIILLWIYLFPIMLTIYIWKNEKIQPKMRYLLIVCLWAFMILCAIYSENHSTDGSHRTSTYRTGENTSTKSNSNAVEETEEKASIAKEKSKDFREGQIKYQFGDYEIQIPSSWERADPYFYPETGSGDKFALLYMMLTEDDSITEEELTSSEGVQALLNAILSGYENGSLLSKKTEEVNGIHVVRSVIEGTLSNRSGTTIYYWFYNPSDGRIAMMAFFQGNETEYDYSDDFEKIVESLHRIK